MQKCKHDATCFLWLKEAQCHIFHELSYQLKVTSWCLFEGRGTGLWVGARCSWFVCPFLMIRDKNTNSACQTTGTPMKKNNYQVSQANTQLWFNQ